MLGDGCSTKFHSSLSVVHSNKCSYISRCMLHIWISHCNLSIFLKFLTCMTLWKCHVLMVVRRHCKLVWLCRNALIHKYGNVVSQRTARRTFKSGATKDEATFASPYRQLWDFESCVRWNNLKQLRIKKDETLKQCKLVIEKRQKINDYPFPSFFYKGRQNFLMLKIKNVEWKS